MASKRETSRYYVEYLGWKESRGLFGREFTEPVVKELLERRRDGELPRMTIKVNEKEMQISQEVAKKSGSKRDKTKYPSIPTKDASFVIQSFYPNSDVVACIFLGYNPYTKCAIHVHAYRFDSEATARMFVDHLSSIIDKPEYRTRMLGIEKDLVDMGHAVVRQQQDASFKGKRLSSEGSDGYSYGTPSPQSTDSLSPSYPTADEALKQRQDIKIKKVPRTKPDNNARRIFTSLQEELQYKMNLEDAPILLPPKDYDTIVRRHGKLDIRDQVKATSRTIVGPNGIFNHVGAEPFNGAVDDVSSGSEKTQESNDTETPTSNGSLEKRNEFSPQNGNRHGLVRSQSDTFANRLHSSSLQRQHSQASSDQSVNSDDMFADGLYQGYRPPKHARSRSKESDKFHVDESGTHMAMWSPSFSFGQTGMKHLPTHHEEDVDALNKTAPAGVLTIPTADYGAYQITRTSGHVQRSHSQKDAGVKYRHSYQ